MIHPGNKLLGFLMGDFYNGMKITFPSIYDYCSHADKLISNEQYQRSNDDERIKAYEMKTAQHA